MNNDTYILEQAQDIVYNRPEEHGNPEYTFATISKFWNTFLQAGGIRDPNITPEDVAKMMILMKMARSAEGHYDEDNPVDVAGYCECWARLETKD